MSLPSKQVSDCAIRETSTREMIWKNILKVWISHFTLTAAHRCKNYSLLLYFNKKKGFSMRSVLTHLPASETVSANWIVVERFEMSQITFILIHNLANQNLYHDDKSKREKERETERDREREEGEGERDYLYWRIREWELQIWNWCSSV